MRKVYRLDTYELSHHLEAQGVDAPTKSRNGFNGAIVKVRRTPMHDRYTLLKRESNLTDKEALLVVIGGITPQPWRWLIDSKRIFSRFTVPRLATMLSPFAAWEISATLNVRDAFDDLIGAWRNWQPYIPNYLLGWAHKLWRLRYSRGNNLVGGHLA